MKTSNRIEIHKKSYKAIVFLGLLLALVLVSCSDEKEKTVGEPIDIMRLDRIYALFPTLSQQEQMQVFKRDSAIAAAQMQVMGVDNSGFDEMVSFCSSEVVTMFAPEVNKVFPDLKAEEQVLGNIVVRAKEQGIDFPQRRYAATIWGLPKSIVANGDVMFIALNHYLGANHEAYEGWPEYQRALKRRDMLPYDMCEALLSLARPYAPGGKQTVLSRLLYEGALVQAKMELLDEPSLASALGVSESQLKDMMVNRKFMWERLLKDDLLHSSDPRVMEQLFAPAPTSAIVSPDAPGRAIRLIGYDIVTSWLKNHKDAKLSQLLSKTFYASESTLGEAKYTPGS